MLYPFVSNIGKKIGIGIGKTKSNGQCEQTVIAIIQYNLSNVIQNTPISVIQVVIDESQNNIRLKVHTFLLSIFLCPSVLAT